MSTAQDIRAALEPVLAPLGLVVEDVSVSRVGRRGVVEVLVDSDVESLDPADTASPVPPLSIDRVAEASRVVSDHLDTLDVMGADEYRLDVSSPGVGRPLTTRDQLRRQVGRLVEMEHAGGTDTGRLVEVGSDRLVLDVPAAKKSPARRVQLDLEDVRRAVVQVEFSRPGAAASETDLDDPDDPDDTNDTNDLNDTNERAADEPATEGDS